ncbi:outer membrane beta-barrel protein [uncultured Bacteroides sp.]|uniref:OmpP1/FadL family transporter n=1 Tax=uncultured Bacteroides sp. TaxID=162156 RepID=UPI0026019159|nr:outer membrane beta-barrel protein [uncultured Bacteroides sp.]
MRKNFLISFLLLIVSIPTFAGGLLTNTNQHAAFLRMLSRGATTEIDGALSNPAGLAFLPNDGFHMALSIQSAFQTRNIDASCQDLGLNKYYEGKASAPVIPSVFAAYKSGDWTLSGFFDITGGGGKASFDDGLPMFDAMVIGGLGAKGIPSNAYSLNSYMDGKQYIYSVQLGLTYKATEWLSAFVGGRMNYFTGGYKGSLRASAAANLPLPTGATIPAGTELIGIDLDCSQTGWGFTPVIGLDAKLGKFNIGAKYEFKTNLNIENSTKANSLRMMGAAESELDAYKHGVNTPNDIPSLLSVAVAYEFLPVLRASVEYHFYDDKNAGMAEGKQKFLTKGTNEYLAGIEWDVTKRLTVSCGAQITDYGLSDNFQRDTSFSCDSYTLGLGAKLKLSERANLNVGYMWTNYDDYTMTTDNYNATGLGGTNVYSRTNKVFGLSLDYRF